jgi:hypothetical protein
MLSLSEAKTKNKESRGLSRKMMQKLRSQMKNEEMQESERFVRDWKPQSCPDLAKNLRDLNLDEGNVADTKLKKYMASLPQLRFGHFVGSYLGLDAAFGALLHPAGGLIGKN